MKPAFFLSKTMPPDIKNKSITRMAPYNYNYRTMQRPSVLLPSPEIVSSRVSAVGPVHVQMSAADGRLLPMSPHWQLRSQNIDESNNFVNLLSSYLKSKNEAYKKEIESLEMALRSAEETSNQLKEKAANLSVALDTLENAVTAVFCLRGH